MCDKREETIGMPLSGLDLEIELEKKAYSCSLLKDAVRDCVGERSSRWDVCCGRGTTRAGDWSSLKQ